jgi:acyl-CoA thioesterase
MIPPFVSLQTIAGWLVVLLVTTTGVAWMAVGFDIADARVLALEAIGRPVDTAEKRAYALTGAGLLALQVALYGATATGFIIWTYAARSNLRSLGARKLEYTTSWAVTGWWIPIVNLIRPYQVIREIWKASDPGTTDPTAWKEIQTPRLLKLWWLFVWLFVSFNIAVLVVTMSAGGVPAQYQFARALSIFADACAAVSATLSYFVVSKVSDAQDEKWELRDQHRAIDDDLLVLTRDRYEPIPMPPTLTPDPALPPRATPVTPVTPATPPQPDTAPTRFDSDTEVEFAGHGIYRTRIDRGWWVVAGPNGGYVAAVLLRALTHAVDAPSRQARSITIHYTAPPVEGPARVETQVERTGRSLTTVSGRLFQDDRLLAVSTAAFSKPRAGLAFSEAAMPDVLPPEQCPPMERHIEIHDRYEQRWALGSQPFSGGDRALCGGWIRLPETRLNDALALAAFSDAFPPAVFSRVGHGEMEGGVPTVELTIHFRTALPHPDAFPDDWVLAVFRSRLAEEGFVEETGELWSQGGVLLAESRQLAIVR